MSYCVIGIHADSCHNRAPFVLVVVVALVMALVFIYIFQKFPNFCGQTSGLGLISVRFWFTKFLLLQPLRWCCVDCVIHHERDVREE